MHEDVRAVVDELDALFLPGRDVLHEPAGEHGREHDVRFGIARFFAPDGQLLRFSFHVVGCAAVEIVDIRRDGVAVGVDTGDAADDPVAMMARTFFTSQPSLPSGGCTKPCTA